jgi:nicotinamide-nucleotide amidase
MVTKYVPPQQGGQRVQNSIASLDAQPEKALHYAILGAWYTMEVWLVKAEIIAIGTELLMGETADTNSGWIATRMPELGIELQWVTTVGDDMPRLTEAIDRAWRRSDFVVTMGGLGPTADDMTRDAIAKVMNETLTLDAGLLKWLEETFQRRGQLMPIHNQQQAGIIPSAVSMPNPMGTAPGWWIKKDGKVLITLPGPPRELMKMWDGEVIERMRPLITGTIIRTRTFKTIGLGEASVDEVVKHLYGQDGVDLGCYAKPDGIYLRAIAKSTKEEVAVSTLDNIDRDIRKVLSPYIWGTDEDRPEEQLGHLLRERGLTLAVMESCTGGMISSAITDIPGSSDYFRGGVVSYSNDAKSFAGVDHSIIEAHGAVSEECATAMTEAVRRNFRADCAISTTGIAGDEEVDGHLGGTVFIGYAHPGGSGVIKHQFPPRRGLVRNRAVTQALLELMRALQTQ